jgi:rfaE bifunctional protein nucleotidyltransferase chain/domain
MKDMLQTSHSEKIKSLGELAIIVEALKADGRVVVQAHGCFDLVHPGHLYHFEQAKKLGNILIVSTVEDRFFQKGPGRPIFNETTRAQWLAALAIVDYVVFCGDVGPYEVIRTIKPHFYVKGERSLPLLENPQSGLSEDKRVCESAGTEMRFTQELPIHSTPLFEKIKEMFD